MIIVTGALGFIGSVVAKDLLQIFPKQNFILVDLLDREQRPQIANSFASFEKEQRVKFIRHSDLWPQLNQQTVDWVIHMGACSSTTELNRAYLKEINTDYTAKLFSWCQVHSVPFIYASSGATYGLGEHGFDESIDPELLRPLNPYGESKVNFDRMILKQPSYPPHWYGLRFFNVYGPNEYFKDDMASVVFKAFQQIQKSGSLRLFRSHHPDYKDGEQLRDFVYVKDISRWIFELIQKKPASGIYNMGFGTCRTWLDLAQLTFAQMQRPIKIEWIDIPEVIRDKYQYYTQAQIHKLQAAQLTSPQWSLEDGIADYLKNYLLLDKIY